jgi:hypothetical protein
LHYNKKYLKIFSHRGLPFSETGINVHNQLKNGIMKFVKLSIVALCLGVFVTSCGDSKPADTSATTTTMATTETVAPATSAPKVDTPTAPAAKVDSAAKK